MELQAGFTHTAHADQREQAAIGPGEQLGELFQLALYPGWLHVSFYDEFLRTSVAGHLAYGSVLGLACVVLARRGQRNRFGGRR